MRIKIRRLPSCAVLLRKKGHSINAIANFLGVSRSIIHRIVKFNGLNHKDLRKIPRLIRERIANRNIFLLEKYRIAWEKFLLGEGDKPP